MRKRNPRYLKVLIIIIASIFLLLIWQIASMLLGSPILLPSVKSVGETLGNLFLRKTFLSDVLFTIYRAFKSFVIIVVSATFLGFLSGRFKILKHFLTPFLTILRATPVMSIILLAFIWFQSGTVPVFSAFLMAFPIMYLQMENAYHSLEKEMDQMCYLYGFSKKQKLISYLIPSLSKYFVIGAKQTLSMIWKVVIAAEVLTVPSHGVGAKMQLAQIQLETSEVLAWTLVAVILTALGDLIFNMIVKLINYVTSKIKENDAK